MNLFGLAPSTLLLLGASFAATVLLLHLLRIRLRQVEVDTLLFFRMAGAVRQPRVLLGRPSRWLALLVALVAGLAGLLAVADPRSGFDRPSRIVVVEPAPGPAGEARLAQARAFAAEHGIGPRGALMAATVDPVVLLSADEPSGAVRALPQVGGGAAGTAAALAAAASLLQAGDEIVWVGAGSVPGSVRSLDDRALQPAEKSIPVRSLAVADRALGALRGIRWQRSGADQSVLVVQAEGAVGGSLVLEGAGAELARAPVEHALDEVELGPFAASGTVSLGLAVDGRMHRVTLDVPVGEPFRVHVDGSVTGAAANALRALLAVDAEFTAVADPAAAQLVVAATDADDARPRLVVHEGAGSGPRLAVLGAGSPVALALRDRQLREASALPALPGLLPWVEDVRQRAVLAGASAADGRLRVHVVRWLLEPETHADVPALLHEALRQLANLPAQSVAVAGEPLALPAGFSSSSGALAEHGSLRLVAAAAGTASLTTPAGTRAVQVVDGVAPALLAPAPATTADVAAVAEHDGASAFAPWLFALLVLVLVLDAVWFHRGRMP